MSSELEPLKQRITELEAENVKIIADYETEIAVLKEENAKISELKKENSDLRMKFANFDAERAELKRRIAEALRSTEEERTRRVAENTKLKARIEELESEFRDRLTKVEQKQTLNDNTPNDNTPNKNSSNFALAPSANSGVVHHEKPLEEKEMDSFLLEAHKKIVSSGIKQHNKEKKLSKAEQASLNQDQESDTGCSTSEKIPEVSNPVTKISAGAPLPKNSHRKKGAENISQMISDGIQNDSQSQKCILGSSNDILLQQSQISSTVPLLTLAQLFDKATDAEYGAIHTNQEEILCWY